MKNVLLVYPGDLNTLTGGYRYDKRIFTELERGRDANSTWQVSLMSLEGNFPFPTERDRQLAAERFATVTDNALVVVDGLAFSVLPELMAKHAQRLLIVALIHHPLSLETGLGAEQSQQLKALETQALQYARHIITTSELTATSLDDYHVPENRITAVMPGTDQAPLARGSAQQTRNLLCVATLTQRKGHKVLLDALHRVRQLHWHLICVGSTERDKLTSSALLEQRQQLNLTDRITFVGEVSESELAEQYAQADVFVLPSFHEGYGMVLSEATAHGLPIIASDAGAIRHTVPDNAGILVPPGDAQALASALARYLEDPQLQSTMRLAAAQARKNLRSWPQAAREFSDVLNRVKVKPGGEMEQ